SSNVTLAITTGTGAAGAALACTANPKAAIGGVATFAGCQIDRAGTGYTLTATDGALMSAVSGSFDVSSATIAIATCTTGTGHRNDVVGTTNVNAGSVTVKIYNGTGTGGALAATLTVNAPFMGVAASFT